MSITEQRLGTERVRSMQIFGGEPCRAELERKELVAQVETLDPNLARRLDDMIVSLAVSAHDLGVWRTFKALGVKVDELQDRLNEVGQ